MIRLLGALVALVLTGLATPALARPGEVPSAYTRVSCGPAGGAWRMRDGGGAGGQPQYAADDWATYSYSCRVGGKLLVVRHQRQPGRTGPCSATDDVLVSAWVDGVKVISRAQAGDYDACVHDEPSERVVRIVLTGRGLTVCRATARPFEGSDPMRCRAAVTAGRRDAAYSPPRLRPPPRLKLTASHDRACPTWTARLALLHDGADRSFAADEIPQARGWRSVNDGQSFGFTKSARFDIDNDGAADDVVWRVAGLSWRGHSLGAPFTRVARGLQTDLFDYAVQPVRLGGRTLIYLRALPRDGVLGNYDLFIADGVDTSRSLVEATPGGRTRLVCAWGPERRPEDAL